MQGLNLLLTKWISSFFEFCEEDPINEITSLNYDKYNNKIIVGVKNGLWVISENTKDGNVRGVFYED